MVDRGKLRIVRRYIVERSSPVREGCAALSLPMTDAFISHLSNELAGLKAGGLYKSERVTGRYAPLLRSSASRPTNT